MSLCFYKFNINFTREQRNQLLSIAKTIDFKPLFNEGNFFSTDLQQLSNAVPKWVVDMFDFSFRRVIFLYNNGNIIPHKDKGRTSVITFPLNSTNAEIVWSEKNQRLKYYTNSYLINVSEMHHVEIDYPTDRYFLQVPLNGTWDENVEYFKKIKLI